jgi:hypothetical protein
MAIWIGCAACGRSYKVDDKWAGKKVKCKDCGAIINVPGGASAPAPARSSKASKPQTARLPSDDPFENVDNLLALEQSGEIEHEDPQQVKARLRELRRKAANQQAPAENLDDRIGAAVERKKSVKKVGPQLIEYAKPADGLMFVDEAYFTIPGEEQIDKWAPIASIGLFVLAVLSPIFILGYGLAMLPDKSVIVWGAVWRFVGTWLLISAGICLFVLVIMGGLAAVGVLIGAAIMKFPKPGGVFKKCAAALSFPMMLHVVVAGIATAAAASSPLARARTGGGVPTLWWFLLPFLVIGMLWLLLRLRPAPFGVAAGLSLALGVGLPLLILMIIGMAMGISTNVMLGGSPKPAAAPAPAPAAFGTSTPGRQSLQTRINPNNVSRPAPPTAPNDAEGRALSEQRLKKIYEALGKYMAANGGKYPTIFNDLTQYGLTEDDMRGPWGSRYVYERPPINFTGPAPAALILAHDPLPRGNQFLVLFGDGKVEWIDMSRWGPARSESARARSELMRQGR